MLKHHKAFLVLEKLLEFFNTWYLKYLLILRAISLDYIKEKLLLLKKLSNIA